MSTVVLEGYLCAGAFLHNLCGFNLCVCVYMCVCVCVCMCERDGFDLDACHLFPQCILAIIPMIGVMQVHSLHTLPGRLGQQLAPSYRPLSGGIGRLHALLGRLGQ